MMTVIHNPSLILDSLSVFSCIDGSSVGHTRSLIFTLSETQEAPIGSPRGQGSIGGPTFFSISIWGSFINNFITFTCVYCILMCCMNYIYFLNNHDNMLTYYM